MLTDTLVKTDFKGSSFCFFKGAVSPSAHLFSHSKTSLEIVEIVALTMSYCPRYTRKNAQVVTSLQTSCNKFVHKLSTSCVRTACF